MNQTPGGAGDGQRGGLTPGAPSEKMPRDPACPPASGELPVLDFARAAKSLGGKVGLLRELLELFVHELPGRLQAIRAAFEAEDFERLRQSAHTVKGSAGMLQALRIQAAARALEAAARDGEKGQCARLLRLLEAEATGLTETVKAHEWPSR